MTKLFTRLALVAAFFVTVSQDVSAEASYQEGTWTVAARAGISPSVFSKKGRLTHTFLAPGATLPASTTAFIDTNTVTQASDEFKFGDLYSVPFTTGFDIGYFVDCNWEVFINFNYEHACNKRFTIRGQADGNDADAILDDDMSARWQVRDLNNYAFYLGSRYYICDWASDCFLPFVGAKLGIKSRSSCGSGENVRIDFDDGSDSIILNRSSGKSCANFSAAFQWGFDWMLDDCYALTLMSEVVGTSGNIFKSGRQLGFTSSVGQQVFSNVSQNPKGVLSFPITLGLRVAL